MGSCLGKPAPPPAKKSAGGSNSGTKGTSNKGSSAAGSNKKDWGLGDRFETIKFLGRGGTSDTWLCKDKKSGALVAVKLIRRPIPRVLQTSVLREITIQADLGWGHDNVIKAYEAILTPSHFALVMECASGGSLTSYVSERFDSARTTGLFLSEDEARYFFKQFIDAVEYCHRNNVAHRDLKLDNTLLDTNDPPVIKLCDFGFAKSWESQDANMMTHIGTPVYMAPELTAPDSLPGMGGEESKVMENGGKKGYVGWKVDVWASGILLVVMLLGTFPFDHIHNQDPNAKEAHLEIWMQQMQKKWSEIPRVAKHMDKLSEEVKSLLDIIMVPEEQRCSIADIKAHPWYNKPLLPAHQKAWEKLQARQVEMNEQRKDVTYNEKLKKARNAKLEQLVQLASKRAELVENGSAVLCVSLLEEEVSENPSTAAAMGTIAE